MGLSTVTTTRTRKFLTPPAWPTFLLGFFACMATLSVCQGIVDVVLPVTRGEEPFGFLFEQTTRLGPAFLVGYVFIHNLGLACIVPGYGFVAAWFERRKQNRALIGILLAGAVIASLLVGLEFILQAHDRFDLPTTLTIFFAEAAAVLALAVPAAMELRGFIPTKRYEWALITPFRNLRVPLAYAIIVLGVVSGLEAWTLLG